MDSFSSGGYPGAEDDLMWIRATLERTRGRGRGWAILILVLGLIGPIRFIPEGKWDLAAVTFGMMAAVAAFLWFLARAQDPRRNRAAWSVLHSPEEVTAVEHFIASDSHGHWHQDVLRIRARGKAVGLNVPEDQVVPMAQALARRCRNAHVRVPGWERPGPGSA